MIPLLQLAGQIARSSSDAKIKNFLMGCVGIRQDGATVFARNGSIISSPQKDYRIIPDAHCEQRVLKKLGKCGTLYVARVLKKDGAYALARPCQLCQMRIRAAKIERVYYTISNTAYGIYFAKKDFPGSNEPCDRVCEI